MLIRPVIDTDSRIDFYAGSNEAFQRIKSLYDALPMEKIGVFYTSPSVASNGINVKRFDSDGDNPLVVSDYRDLNSIFYTAEERPLIMLEYEYIKETRGLLNTITLFLCRDQKTYDLRRISSNNVIKFDDVNSAVKELLKFIKGDNPTQIESIGGKSVGIIYMSFGDKAPRAIRKSIASLKRLGISYPVAVVGDNSIDNHSFIEWKGASPFDGKQKKNFQFRAGRIKPSLIQLTPFDYTLYIDADTRFLQPIQYGFDLLSKYDMAVTEEILTLKDLYNKRMAGWELNLLERDTTIIELGNENLPFVNSGVMFFKKNKKTFKLFSDWWTEWSRFQEWDEQLALMRAIHLNKNIKVNYLPVEWNSPHHKDESIIFHNYGRGEVRVNV